MSPPRGGDSWKWSDTENQSKPLASANFHSFRISSSGPPMWPMWIPNVIAMEAPLGAQTTRRRLSIGGASWNFKPRTRSAHQELARRLAAHELDLVLRDALG